MGNRVWFFQGSPSESGGGAGMVAATPNIILVSESVSIYGLVLGESDYLPIGLDVNVLDIDVRLYRMEDSIPYRQET